MRYSSHTGLKIYKYV